MYEDTGELEAERGLYRMEDYAHQTLGFDVQQGRPVRVEKLVSFYTSHDSAINEPLANAEKTVGRFATFDEAIDHLRGLTLPMRFRGLLIEVTFKGGHLRVGAEFDSLNRSMKVGVGDQVREIRSGESHTFDL